MSQWKPKPKDAAMVCIRVICPTSICCSTDTPSHVIPLAGWLLSVVLCLLPLSGQSFVVRSTDPLSQRHIVSLSDRHLCPLTGRSVNLLLNSLNLLEIFSIF
ncbi:hypothetical protein GDO78_012835 [Eleutherodactylus coqui]|uniref:Uncharacterized protein n=1 Tax=Eleutherodactylus coqui TaxID=57060 RepID=A0A8J6K5F6_ELECQ|nr:hypothetical protein GDO78_012835 [Eleutherodactylus coqui]